MSKRENGHHGRTASAGSGTIHRASSWLGPVTEGAVTRRVFVGASLASCLAGPALLSGCASKEDVPAAGLPAAYRPVRTRVPNPYVEGGRPIVVVVSGSDFPAMLAKAMTMLGGFARLGADRSVIVKPNFVFDKRTRYPTTTDEGSVLATVEMLQREGFNSICVADRRGKRAADGRAGGKFEWSGLNDKAEVGGFTTDSLMDDSVAEAVQVRDDRFSELPSVGVITKIYEAGVIINMPTLKRHTQTNLTCSLKNFMGVLDVPTTEAMHLWGDEHAEAAKALTRDAIHQRLCRTIAEAALAVSPELTVIDARTALCRNHLSVAEGGPLELNRLIVSGDPVAADVVAARLLGEACEDYELGPTAETFSRATSLGLGESEPHRFVLQEAEV